MHGQTPSELENLTKTIIQVKNGNALRLSALSLCLCGHTTKGKSMCAVRTHREEGAKAANMKTALKYTSLKHREFMLYF